MPLTFEQYIAQFEELDKYGEYSDRLKEELRDHFDDSVHSGLVMGKSEPAAKQTALKNLGESKIIIHEFKKIMKFNNKYAMWMESLFLGIISIPFMQFGFLIFSIFTGMYTNEIFPKSSIGGYMLSYLLVFALFSGFYFLVVRRVFRFLENKKRILYFGFGLFILPFLFAWNFTDWSLSLRGELGFLQYLLFVLLPAIVSFSLIIWIFNKKKESFFKRKQETKWWEKIASWIPFALALIFIPGILLTNQAFVPMDSSVNRSFLDFISFVRGGIEYINVPILDFGGNEGFYLFGAIYLFLAFVCLYHIVFFFLDKNQVRNIQKFPWLLLTLLVYIFSLFFLVKPNVTVQTISWHVPVVNISEELKKEQLGFLFKPVMYLESLFLGRDKPFFLYQIKRGKHSFEIINPNNEGTPVTYYLGFPNVDDSFQDMVIDITGKPQGPLLGLELKDKPEGIIQPFFHGSVSLPKEVECKTNFSKTVRYSNNPDHTTYCHEFFYNGKLIYTQDHADPFYQFEMMPDYPKYALLRFNRGDYGPQEVYLINISN